jgi:hypothetical protein
MVLDMTSRRVHRLLMAALLSASWLWPAAASAQVDFTGNWGARYHEDQPERIPGPELGDYSVGAVTGWPV